MRIDLGGVARLAIYLTAFYAAAYVSGVESRRPTNALSYTLSKQIELMLRAHERVKRQKEETEASAEPRNNTRGSAIAPPRPRAMFESFDLCPILLATN